VARLGLWFEARKRKADFHIVYIREAHPSDGWQLPVNVRQGVVYEDPETDAERRKVASDCIEKLGIRIPAILDGMDDAMMHAYNAWPNRVYIVGGDGLVWFKGPWGPRGISGARFEQPLADLLARPGGGRFTDVTPRVRRLVGLPVAIADIPIPEGFRSAGTETEAFAADVPKLVARGREFLKTTGLLKSGVPGVAVREETLVLVDAEGRERKDRTSRLWRLRYRRFARNVPIEGERIDVVFDATGIREIAGRWHRLGLTEADAGAARITSQQAAEEAKMPQAIARLVYVRRDGPEGGVEFRPVFRLRQGAQTKDVEVLR
jgi:hypothetical protein